MKRQEAEKRGRGAETLACWYLRLKGWRIVARRAESPAERSISSLAAGERSPLSR